MAVGVENMKHNLSLAALKAAYSSGSITPTVLLHRLREAAEATSDYNAWIHLLSEQELDGFLTKLKGKSADDLPLYGVPFAIKDNIDLAGIPTTAACEEFKYVPEVSAFVVQQLLNAGAIPLGKTNLDQFATGLVGVRSPYGEGKNVFNSDYVSGGSSAGSAIATGLGLVSFALGTDTAGSGRVPAAFNNLVGYKPTRGLLSNTGVVPACKSLDCVSVFTWNTDDAALIHDIVSQYDSTDCYARGNTALNRARYYTNQLPEKFRFAVPDTLTFFGNTEAEEIFKRSLNELKALGGEAVEINFQPFIDAAKLLYEGPWVAERWLATEQVSRDAMLPVIRTIVEGAEGKTAADAFNAQYQLQAYKKLCDAALADVEFLLIPTAPTAFTRAQLEQEPIKNNSILGTYTNFVNLLDYSAMAVPTGKLSSGVHWGVTFVGQAFEDIRLLGFAGALHKRMMQTSGATEFSLPTLQQTLSPANTKNVSVVVCGAHLTGMPLNWQLTERSARLVSQTRSSAKYQLYALPDGKRPAMVRNDNDGKAIEVEVWAMPVENFGSFVAGIPAPLGIGKVELENGEILPGFVCEHGGIQDAADITEFGGWRAWLAHLVDG